MSEGSWVRLYSVGPFTLWRREGAGQRFASTHTVTLGEKRPHERDLGLDVSGPTLLRLCKAVARARNLSPAPEICVFCGEANPRTSTEYKGYRVVCAECEGLMQRLHEMLDAEEGSQT